MNHSLDLHDHLHDHVALDEIELYAEVLIAVADADRPLSPEEIDRVLGLSGTPAVPAEAARPGGPLPRGGSGPADGTANVHDPVPEQPPRAAGPVPGHVVRPRDGDPGTRRSWSTDPLPAEYRLPPAVLPAPRDVPEPHVLWSPLPLAPWHV
ncbi:hypothetical protein ACFW53_15580 [Nocardiopsis dassonvillei]|uniref:hypothetical protein n=1 Tax=Nocardiopsis dassonvillei TaxID=2014 RepID=UPI00367029D2